LKRLVIHGVGRSGTTFIQQIVNSHPCIWVTNEFLLYDLALGANVGKKSHPKGAWQYYMRLGLRNNWNQSKEHFWDVPPTFNSSFVPDSIKELGTEMGVVNWIKAAERVLYDSDIAYTWFGDKVLEVNTLRRMRELELSYKVIYIYRDGRDNLVSRYRSKFGGNAEIWAKGVKDWWRLREELDSELYREIKFEDLIDKPGNVILKIGKWLRVDTDCMSLYAAMNIREPGIGDYKKVMPNWRRQFKGEPLRVLQELGYVE